MNTLIHAFAVLIPITSIATATVAPGIGLLMAGLMFAGLKYKVFQ